MCFSLRCGGQYLICAEQVTRVVHGGFLPPLYKTCFLPSNMGGVLLGSVCLRARPQVRQALQVLTHDALGFGFARTRVAVSTVAPSPAAVRAAADLPAMLAWSVCLFV